MNDQSITSAKLYWLIENISQYEKVAVAYSGGIDSSLLLYAAKTALGAGNVVALTLISSVVPTYAVQNCRTLLKESIFNGISHREILVNPFEWDDFTKNSGDRCYFCKKRMYLTLIDSMKNSPFFILFDGTNVDDTKEDRPGRKAVQELNVKTPLLEAGLRKNEIRILAKKVGLSNYDLPSNSCLATRIPTGMCIKEEMLNRIDQAESFLVREGFSGCRVKPYESYTVIEVQASQMKDVIRPENRNRIKEFFASLNFLAVALSLKHR